MAATNLIYDGDMGGDDLWAITLLLAHPDKFRILGFSTCYGNVSQPFATQNLLNHLHWLHQESFDVAQGANTPCDGMRPFGDDAYGQDGVGGVIFPRSSQKAWQGDIADWYAEKLDPAAHATVFCTGPATNIARFIEKYPQKAAQIKDFVFMGGAINPPGKDGKLVFDQNGVQRIGNITKFAEFNAFQDPKALNIILNSDIKTTFVSADATQNLVYTAERQARIQAIHEPYGSAYNRMLMVVEELDRTKFGVDGPFIHDAAAAAYLVSPELFAGETLNGLRFDESAPYPMEDTRRGQAIIGDGNSKALWLNGVTDADAVFNVIEDGLKTTVLRALENRALLAG